MAPSPAAEARPALLLGSPPEILARIVPDDPLGLRARVAARLGERALLLDAERVLLRAQASVALHAPVWRGQPPLAVWLEARVDEALALLLAEDGAPPVPAARDGLAAFATPLELDPRELARACARFNRLPLAERQAFFALVLDGRGPEQVARAGSVALPELVRRARRALEPFQAAVPRSPRGS